MIRQSLTVDLGARSYDIHIGQGVLADAPRLISPHLKRDRLAIVTDENVAETQLPAVLQALRAAAIRTDYLVLPAGERTKNWNDLGRTVEWLLEQKIERDDLLVALGGGVIGDLAGCAAAVLRRGIGFVQMPTSLLAQVDSSVGGKTGINSPHGKNLIGAFHQPRLVLADTDALSTLSDREFLSGYAEVAKYGLLGDAAFFEWLEANGAALARGDTEARVRAIYRSCEMKAEIVARDEFEHGDRALLNLGHTFGHALEAATGYSDRLLHGEGVSIGCVLAYDMSARLGLCAQEAPSRVAAHFRAMGMKTTLADIEGDLPDADALISLMAQDKKVRDGALTFILARGIGDAFVERNVTGDVVRPTLQDALAGR